MFSKSKAPTDRPVPRVASAPSLISQGLSVTGDLTSEGEIQVDGEVTGDIDCQQLVIGEAAHVRGEIIADTVTIRGEVNGRVRGSEVTLAKSARVVGDVLHRSLAMEAGAHLEGQVRRVDDPRAPIPAGGPKLLHGGADVREKEQVQES